MIALIHALATQPVWLAKLRGYYKRLRVLGEVSSQSTLANINNAIYDKINLSKEEITMQKISCSLVSCFAENYYHII